MGFLDEMIFKPLTENLVNLVSENLNVMFTDVNQKVGEIATEVGRTPEAWNSSIFSIVKGLSETAIVPIAGIIITYVFCNELIQMVTDKNSMQEVDASTLYKCLFKTGICIFVVTNCFDITTAIFDVGMSIINNAASFISGNTNIDISDAITNMQDELSEMGLLDLLLLSIETYLLRWGMKGMALYIQIKLYIRMIEIYFYISMAPIPYATLGNREFSGVGHNYLKAILSLSFQGFFYILVVGIYSVLTRDITLSGSIQDSLFNVVIYTILLVFCIGKIGSISKAIFNSQ